MELIDPLTDWKGLGPLASAAQHQRVSGFIANATAIGARQVTKNNDERLAGSYVRPVVFDQVTSDMSIAREEIFGPVLSVLKFKTTNEAIRIANDTHYGLAATVWTRDLRTAMKSVSEINAGKVVVLSDELVGEGAGFSLGSEPWNQSGFGVESGMAGVRSYSRTKSVEIVSK
jgi:acyl-CoA reductase-like NAD-dependent aldehyde dehydrogenase